MRQRKHHKLLLINTLEVSDETFETNETVFQGFYSLSLFLHMFNQLFIVSFCLILSQISLILSHFVSFQKTIRQVITIFKRENNMGLKNQHKSIEINYLSFCSGNFGTNGTDFRVFSAYHCFYSYLSRFSSPNLSHLVPNWVLLSQLVSNQIYFVLIVFVVFLF